MVTWQNNSLLRSDDQSIAQIRDGRDHVEDHGHDQSQ